jgi:CheY-like chemotaxis protein
LTLESTLGKGTTATLWLPAVDHSRVESQAATHETEVPARPMSVLLVDDDDLVRAGAAVMLEAFGHSVVQVSSAARALDHLASREHFDVLVTDQRMPGMTGVDLIRRARFMRPDLPAVLITGYTDAIDPDASVLPVLAKPFRAAELARAVADAVKHDHGAV